MASTHAEAVFAAKKVVITYEDMPGPVILTIDDAIAHNSFFGPPFNQIVSGDLPAEVAAAEVT